MLNPGFEIQSTCQYSTGYSNRSKIKRHATHQACMPAFPNLLSPGLLIISLKHVSIRGSFSLWIDQKKNHGGEESSTCRRSFWAGKEAVDESEDFCWSGACSVLFGGSRVLGERPSSWYISSPPTKTVPVRILIINKTASFYCYYCKKIIIVW